MLTSNKTLAKIEKIKKQYEKLRYYKIKNISVKMFETTKHYRKKPSISKDKWQKVKKGTEWGEEWSSAWFKGEVTLSDKSAGEPVYVRAKTGARETLFFVDGKPKGGFDSNHREVLLTSEGKEGDTYNLSFEAYAGHAYQPSHPYNEPATFSGPCIFDGIEMVLERKEVSNFVFDLKALISLKNALGDNSL